MSIREHLLSKRYYDDVRFPYGFKRSGLFTIAESECLETKGAYFKALQEGIVSDLDEEDIRTIKVLRGELDAKSFEEKTWLKYSMAPKKSQIWLCDREKKQLEAQYASEDEDDITVDFDDALDDDEFDY